MVSTQITDSKKDMHTILRHPLWLQRVIIKTKLKVNLIFLLSVFNIINSGFSSLSRGYKSSPTNMQISFFRRGDLQNRACSD